MEGFVPDSPGHLALLIKRFLNCAKIHTNHLLTVFLPFDDIQKYEIKNLAAIDRCPQLLLFSSIWVCELVVFELILYCLPHHGRCLLTKKIE